MLFRSVELLLKSGADENALNKEGKMPHQVKIEELDIESLLDADDD